MSDTNTVRPHLERRFASQRIVFWHDPNGQYADDLDSLDLPRVETIRVADNEFGVRHRLLRSGSTEKFLVYRAGRVADGIGNWLLDLELAYGVFTADRGSLIAQDLGLDAVGVDEVVRAHEKFFSADQRIEALKALLNPGDDLDRLQAKMVAVVLGQREHLLAEITRTLLIENAQGQHAKYDAIADYGLDDFHWRGTARIYGYKSDSPSVDDLVLWIFQQATNGFQSDRLGGLRNIQFDFTNLRNDRRSEAALATLAKRAARDLGYASAIEDTSFRDLVTTDVFEEADRKIISDLARLIADQGVSAREVAEVVRARQDGFWYEDYQKVYRAIASAAELLAAIAAVDLSVKSFDEGLERYRREWFRIDQLYRQFVFLARTAEHQQPLEPLRGQVEKRYTNGFLYELGTAWQKQVDEADRWRSADLSAQASFYTKYIEPLVRDGDKKAVVIISDALRYEVADELGSRIRQEDRFDATLDAVLGVLPSYTQLGMAALLPHSTLAHTPDAETVLADGQPTNGTEARGKVLQQVGGTAIRAERFKELSPEQRREIFKANRVLYVYHNRIDATGDKPDTEQLVAEAAEETLRELVALVKMLANANATNIFLTADHGFLFQDGALPDTFYLSAKPQGDDMLVINKRYVLGHGLKPDSAFTRFTSAQLGLQGDLEVQVPKSIHRLRVAGGGSRYVHGGATLQEIVVPVLTVNKKRKSDIRPVRVEIWPETDKITTGQVAVRLFQAEPVSDKVQPCTLRAGLYVGETLISNAVSLTFDRTAEDKRDRYQYARLILSQDADAYNNHVVEFRLAEPIPNTTQWKTYSKVSYTLKRSFTSDFDF
jgi:uncharacterized protein (TIGR02687 family)